MAGINGKNKGNSQERKISNLLSERFQAITGIEKSFRRNPDSGSFWGASNQKRKDTHDTAHAHFGDIICPDNFKFSLESKAYKTGPSFAAIVKGEITQWDLWWSQTTQDAANAKKEPLLIVKYNGVKELAFTNKEVVGLVLVIKYKDMYGYRLEDFLNQKDEKFFNLAPVTV